MNMSVNKRALASGISAIAVAVALTVATPAMAQTTSSVEGHATAGSVVTVTDTTTGHSDSTTVDASGHYSILGLTPSTYRVQSGATVQTVVVPLGQAVTVDLVGTAAETTPGGAIVVTGSRTKDVKTPAVATNVSRFQIENLPNGDRNFLNFAALAPGVTVSPPTLNGKARQVQAGGINSDNTNTFIDGISIKNLVNHGGTVGQNYSSGNPFPASAVDQFDVQTQNFKAEFEQAGSAVISSVTKTGGERFHGEIFGEYQPKSFISENYVDRPGQINNPTAPYKTKPNYQTKYYGGNLGGPIIPQKLTFFVDFEGTDKRFGSNDVNVYPGNITLGSPAVQAYAQSARSQYNGSFPVTFNEKLYFGKLTYFATPADTINLSAFIRHESNLSIGGGVTTADASSRNRNNENRYEMWWSHRGSSFLNELFIARDVAANGSIPNLDGPASVVTYGSNNTPVLQLGGNNFTQDDHQYQSLIKDNVTFSGGPHTVKVGGKLNFTKLQRLEGTTSATYYYDATTFTGLGSTAPYQATINVADVQPVTAKNTEIGLFVQDDWRPNDHLVVNAGLRWDYESNAKNENFVTPADVAAALRAYPGFQAAGMNPEDYISTGHNRKPFLGAFQPRLGASYDVYGDRSLVLVGGIGRYYDRSLFIDSALETIKDYYQINVTLRTCAVAPSDPTCVNVLPTDPTALRALASGTGGEVHLLNNNTKTPFTDQFNAGVRKRFGNINTSLTFAYIKAHNIYQELVGNRYPNGSYGVGNDQIFILNGIPYSRGIFYRGAAIFESRLSAQHGALFIGNSDGKADYAAIYLHADKPYTDLSGWGFTTSLTVSSSRSNDTRNTNSIGDPFNFDAPTIGEQGWGSSSGLERWRFVGSGTVRLPLDVKLSSVVTLSSGPSYGGVVCGVPVTYGYGPTDCFTTNFGIYRPHGIGYKNVDVNLSKTFHRPGNPDQGLTVYFQALNVFDTVNRNYSMWGGGFRSSPTTAPSNKFDPNSVAGQGRNFKVGARVTF